MRTQLIVLLSVAASAPGQDWSVIEKDVEALVQRWGVPGVVVGVTQDGEVSWKSNFGVCRAGETRPVNAQTLFDIGSISKCITAMAVMLLAERGEVNLDKPSCRYLPSLKFPTVGLDQQVTLRDLLSHRTGLAPDNVMFWNNGLTRSEVLDRVRYLPVTARLGQTFQYHNVMFLAAGEVVGAVCDSTWDQFVEEELFGTLGMRRTAATRRRLGQRDNQAHPHVRFAQEWRPIPFLDLHNAAPAGAVVSCLDDLLIWARMLLALGLHDGKQVVDSASLEEMWSPHIAIPIGGPYAQAMPFSKQPGYGLGFMVHEYAGREIVEHGGQTDGMHAEMFLVPEEELGVVVLTNGLNLFLPHAIAYRIVDEIFERPIQPAQTAFWKSWQQMAPGMTALKFQAPSRITPPTQELRARWQGSYRSGLYGEASLSGAGEHLTLTALGRTATLHAMGGGRFAVDWGRDLFMNISATTLQIRTAAEPAGDRLVLRSVAFSRAP